MCVNLGSALQLAGGMFQYQAQGAAGQAQANMYNYQAEMAKEVGKRRQEDLAISTSKLYGTQRAAMAANGLMSSSVTAEDILNDTAIQSKLDSKTLQWETDNEVAQNQAAASNAKAAARSAQIGTLIGTASNIANSYNDWKQVAGNKTASTTSKKFTFDSSFKYEPKYRF